MTKNCGSATFKLAISFTVMMFELCNTCVYLPQRVELCVRCLEMWLEQRLDDSATLIVAFQVQGRLAVIAKPLPNKYVYKPDHLVLVHA